MAPGIGCPLAAARSPARGTVPNGSRYVNDGMELEMEQQQVEEGDRAVVARRLSRRCVSCIRIASLP
jgi:hypothetical protein